MTTITLVRGDLYRVAATYLGDATRWIEIARLNGLDDPMIRSPLTLRLPADASGTPRDQP